MFGRKKSAAKISDKTPVFHVRYIGCTETFVAAGKGCSYMPVQRLWDNSPAEKHMRKVAIHINPMGLRLHDQSEKSTDAQQHQQHKPPTQQQQQQQQQQPYKEFDIENISFCNVDRAVNERIFSWIYRNEQQNRLDCHAVLCSTRQKAQTMAIVLSRAFQIAYKDWRAHHRNYTSPAPPPAASSSSSVARSESKTSSASNGSSSAGLKDKEKRNGSPATCTAATAAASKPTSSSGASSLTSAEGGNGETLLSMAALQAENNTALESMIQRQHATTSLPDAGHPFSDDGSGMSGNGVIHEDDDGAAARGVTSSVSVQQSLTSSHFVSNSILDPEMEEVIGGVDGLNADIDLEDNDDN